MIIEIGLAVGIGADTGIGSGHGRRGRTSASCQTIREVEAALTPGGATAASGEIAERVVFVDLVMIP